MNQIQRIKKEAKAEYFINEARNRSGVSGNIENASWVKNADETYSAIFLTPEIGFLTIRKTDDRWITHHNFDSFDGAIFTESIDEAQSLALLDLQNRLRVLSDMVLRYGKLNK